MARRRRGRVKLNRIFDFLEKLDEVPLRRGGLGVGVTAEDAEALRKMLFRAGRFSEIDRSVKSAEPHHD